MESQARTPIFSLTEADEYRRMRALEETYDPPTLRLLDKIGVAPGWRCMEIAAGAGSIALALQLRAGSVIALDSDTTHIRHLTSPTFAVIEGLIQDAELPLDLDLIHARFILDLLPRPQEVVEKLRLCLRPGGWLILEEFDDITMNGSSGTDRQRSLHDSVVAAKQAVWTNRGLDNYLGRKLPNWLLSMGLSDVDSECGCHVRMGGSSGVFGWRQSLMGMRQNLIDVELSVDEFGEYVEQLGTKGFSYLSPLVVSAFGRVPI